MTQGPLATRPTSRSGSRRVAGYVKAVLRYRTLKARYEARLAKFETLRRRMDEAKNKVAEREMTMRGGWLAEARRILEGEVRHGG